ncbi:hypothetical protein [Bosea sp. AS-1]|uniref:hypothetical protein n=1 Tax=Bosea sp. AS-1 TaxID=2015316 RepID=UPI000B79063F|nr:hypothetical protein [Bosea sp. AS-1]
MWWRKQKYPYRVVVHLDGRHPYLESHDLDYPSRDVTLTVPATGWDDAAKQALACSSGLNSWRRWVVSMERAP